MLKLLADENFPGPAVRGLLRLRPTLDLLRIQDVGLRTADDPAILAWAAEKDRIVLSLDRGTFVYYAESRIDDGDPMPGVFIFSRRMSTRQIIDEILVVDELTSTDAWSGKVVRFPL